MRDSLTVRAADFGIVLEDIAITHLSFGTEFTKVLALQLPLHGVLGRLAEIALVGHHTAVDAGGCSVIAAVPVGPANPPGSCASSQASGHMLDA